MIIKNIFITGAGGFIGSHLTERLIDLGYNVTALVHYNSKNSSGWLDTIINRPRITIIAGDVCDYQTIYHAMKGADTIIHLAALVGIPYSYNSPLSYIRTNIEGTYNILLAAKTLKIRNILITSTSETYGTAQYAPIDEKHPLIPQSPYAASKIGAESLSLSFFYSYGLPVKVVKPFNTYGPRQSARAVIPTIILQILSGQKSIRLGNVYPKRDFTYVNDIVDGFIKIALNQELFGQVINLGRAEEISISSLCQKIAKLIGVKIQIIIENKRVRPKTSEVERLLCDSSKLKKYTDWQSQYPLEKGLKETFAWLRKNRGYYKDDGYNI